MAINSKAMKTLFGTLAPAADDIAAGVAKYGNGAASALISDNVGRALPSLDLYNDELLDALEDMVNIRQRKSSALGNLFNDANQLSF